MAQKVSKKIANAIDYVFMNNDGKAIITNINNLVFCDPNQLNKQGRLLQEHYIDSGEFLSLLDVIVNGYEIEETPEEKVLELYERATCLKIIDRSEAYRSGMRDFARIYNIPINWTEID
ncbi:hypothetical protein [Paenibacillus oleatilyticus]|uniref:hypothetical protein n=1 Tax=Paenibacillus oleatilyticus TaxID=2594886 RepID=UPI001C1F6F65|nr:hypothetical protein [Paenibacillus oleatilyticus]MBU7315975.1 hypothetical protein [Paenibacillus oleatilyticus]